MDPEGLASPRPGRGCGRQPYGCLADPPARAVALARGGGTRHARTMDWFDHGRPLGPIGNVPLAEASRHVRSEPQALAAQAKPNGLRETQRGSNVGVPVPVRNPASATSQEERVSLRCDPRQASPWGCQFLAASSASNRHCTSKPLRAGASSILTLEFRFPNGFARRAQTLCANGDHIACRSHSPCMITLASCPHSTVFYFDTATNLTCFNSY